MAHELRISGSAEERDVGGIDREALRRARVDLAACFRMAARYGLEEGICNHFSALVPGRDDLFLVNPYGLSFAEVTASNLLVCDFDGHVVDGDGRPEATAFFIHARLHKRLPRARAAFHTHMPKATALSMVEGEPLAWAGQTALKFYGRTAVDDAYNGLALDEAEGDRIAATLGGADVVFLRNHGVMVTGPTIAEAWDDLYYLERAAEVQVKALSTGRRLRSVDPDVARRVAAQMREGRPRERTPASGKRQAHAHARRSRLRELSPSNPKPASQRSGGRTIMSERVPRTGWRTRLIHSQARVSADFRSLATPVFRGSTVVFDRLADARDDWTAENGYTYGLYGTPTTRELAERIAELEGAHHTFVVPGGQAAIALIFLAYCRAGSHVLVPDSAYRPAAQLASGLLDKLGVEVEIYPAMIGAGIEAHIRPDTALLWCESPGSITMEVQDVPALVAAARRHGVSVALDNTYAAGILFDAFAHGVNVSMQALTKYVGGHSDLLLGTVSVRDEAHRRTVGETHRLLGLAVSPDDCSLALRGLQTLGLRLERLERTALAVARWMAERPEVESVLHPALPGSPGHEIWRRDFDGSSSIFSIVLRADLGRDVVTRFVDGLRLFKIGFSWGGVTSLVMAYDSVARGRVDIGPRLVRLNVGLEDEGDLIGDLAAALDDAQG